MAQAYLHLSILLAVSAGRGLCVGAALFEFLTQMAGEGCTFVVLLGSCKANWFQWMCLHLQTWN